MIKIEKRKKKSHLYVGYSMRIVDGATFSGEVKILI